MGSRQYVVYLTEYTFVEITARSDGIVWRDSNGVPLFVSTAIAREIATVLPLLADAVDRQRMAEEERQREIAEQRGTHG